jgi:hypothetical protein
MRGKSLVVIAALSAALAVGAAAAPVKIAVIMPSATTDAAFSQSMWSALLAVQKELGGESAIVLKYTENMWNVPDAAAAIRDYASSGFDIVIAHGSQYGSSVQEIAKDFPKVTFAWGTDVDTYGLPNVYAYTAAAEQGGFVNGVLAAKLTASKKVGVTGPIEVGDAKTYIDGFVQGLQSVDKTIAVSKTWTGSFSDVALMTAAAKTHIASGADILTGSSQSVVGSIGAAKDAGQGALVRHPGRSGLPRPGPRRREPGLRLDRHAQGHPRQAQGRRPRRRRLHPHPRERRPQGRLQPRVQARRGRQEGGPTSRIAGHQEGHDQGEPLRNGRGSAYESTQWFRAEHAWPRSRPAG